MVPTLLVVLPYVCSGALLGLAGYFFLVKKKRGARTYRQLAYAGIALKIFYAVANTANQWYAWSGDSFSKTFLTMPLEPKFLAPIFGRFAGMFNYPHGYFIFYSLSRFWLNTIVAIVIATIFYCLLRFIARNNARLFEPGEPEIGFLTALIAGWPGMAILIPLAFGGMLLTSLYRLALFKESHITLGLPFLIAGVVMLAFGNTLLNYTNLIYLSV